MKSRSVISSMTKQRYGNKGESLRQTRFYGERWKTSSYSLSSAPDDSDNTDNHTVNSFGTNLKQMRMETQAFDSLPDLCECSSHDGSSRRSDSDVSALSSTGSIQLQELNNSGSSSRRLHWGNLEVRFYPIIIGDHPDAHEGPPLTIDWQHVSTMKMGIDEYEAGRLPRRHENELRLDWFKRRRLLKRLGMSDEELSCAQLAVGKARLQRETTISRIKFDRITEFKEAIIRSIGKRFQGKVALNARY